MEVKHALALPDGLELVGLEKVDNLLIVIVVSTQLSACCPLCGVLTNRIHSHYQRQVADLPAGGQPVRLLLQVRKFFCDEPICARKIFTERLTPFVEPWARMTKRLFQIVQMIGLATGGRLGVRLTDHLGIQVSRLTIIRRIMSLPTDPVRDVIELGIDDFSFRRGRKFGTILVDLRTHQVLDLLPDRTAHTSANWMSQHPEIQLVSRDRGGDYAAAAYASVPQATQCADRFHLLLNLSKALEGVLMRHLAAHRKHQRDLARASPGLLQEQPPPPVPKKIALRQAKREQRLVQYQQVIALREQGFSQTAIAEQVGIGHATVSRWLRHGSFPEQRPRPRSASVDPHLPQLIERWEAGSHTVAELHRELVADGYSHQYNSVYRRLVRYFPERRKKHFTRSLPKNASDQPPHPPILARQAMFLFIRQPEELSDDEQKTLTLLRSLHTEVDQAYELVQQFACMLRMRKGELLDDWLCRVKASRIREFQGFVTGILQDKAAVKAGLILPASQGVVIFPRNGGVVKA